MVEMRADGFWRQYSRNKLAVFGLGIVAGVVIGTLCAPLIRPGDPLAVVGYPFEWPGHDPRFPLGTDLLGRDLLSEMLHGAGHSLAIGISVALGASLVGGLIGLVAGYYRGWTDAILMRLAEIFQAVPGFLLVIIIVALFSSSFVTIGAAIVAVSWPSIARLVRAETMRLRSSDFVAACATFGMSDPRILLTQILPNCLPPLIVTTSVMTASGILIEAGLSFIGLGDPAALSWGTMLATGREALYNGWYMSAFPGVAIVVTVIGINLVGEGLNDAFNPRRQRRGG
jgi:peptide/nickel transport system permease protein